VTLPSVKWGLLYGIILCNARAIGEFGAVSVVSTKIAGQTETLPLRVEKLHLSATAASGTSAFAVASLLALLALLTLVLKTLMEWKTERDHEQAQRVPNEPAKE
jgi:sulfate transport system permease protein